MAEMNNDFESRLAQAVSKVMGAIAAGIVGADGIPVAEFKGDDEFDVSIASAELASIVADATRISQDLQGGDFEESIVKSSDITLVTRMIGKDFYTFIAMKGKLQNLGLARFELKKMSEELKDSLST